MERRRTTAETSAPPRTTTPSTREKNKKPEPATATERKESAAAMGVSLAQAVAELVERCARRLSRAARRLQVRRGAAGSSFPSRAVVPFLGGKTKRALSWPATSKKGSKAAEEDWGMEAEPGDGVWRKEILLGERCQHLEFSGAIHYDAEGRRLDAPPTPRTPMRSPLPASLKLAANA